MTAEWTGRLILTICDERVDYTEIHVIDPIRNMVYLFRYASSNVNLGFVRKRQRWSLSFPELSLFYW